MLVQSLAPQLQPGSTPHLNLPNTMPASSGDIAWVNQRSYSADAMDVFSWNYYTLPPSPPASVSSNTDDSPQLDRKTIKSHFSPEPHSESEQKSCLPTSQVFELDGVEALSTSSSASPPPSIPCQLPISSDNGSPLKRTFSTIGGMKKGRGNGERITTKDFVPPDVTGLSKREARLLKNRAAAFLSRQRKREEFEAMEIRVKELEEENSRLQVFAAAKGKKYDDLVSSMEQLRLRLSMAEKRERDLTVELVNQTATNLAVKTESHDFNLPPSPYSPYTLTGQPSVITVMKQSLLSLLPSLLSLPSQTSLPISLSVPLTGSSPARHSSITFNHQQSTSCDIKDQGRPLVSHGNAGFHPNSADISSKKVATGGEAPEACQFDTDGPRCLDNVAISFDLSQVEDGRGYVHVHMHVSEKHSQSTFHGSGQRPSSLTCWPEGNPSLRMACYASPPLSAQVNMPSPGGIDHLGVFAGAGDAHAHSRMGFDPQLMTSGYHTPFAQHDPDHSFDYYPGIIPE